MGPELEDKGRSGSTMDASVNKENGTAAREVEDKHLTCISNYEDCAFEMDMPHVERTIEGCGGEDGKVDIVDTTHSSCNELVEEKCQETTESSSSFDSISGFENGAALADAEVVSDFHEDATSALAIDGISELPRIRKRRLTSHWRAFIRPLAWRCKWVELQAKKFKMLAHKYDSELEEINRKKLLPVENLVMDVGTKSTPFSRDCPNFKVLKRKKRRRIEDTVDKRTYMSQHNLFCYYENRSAIADGASLDDEWSKLENINYSDEIENELLRLESREGDESLEQMLRKIGILQGQVHQLKARLDEVMNDNAGKFSHADNTSPLVPCNGFMSSAGDPASPPNTGVRTVAGSSYIASQRVAEYSMGNVVLQESAVPSHGEVMHPPDIIESTNQSHLGGVCHIEDDILIYNEKVKEEMNNFGDVKFQSTGKVQQAPKERQENTAPLALIEPDLLADDQPAPKLRSISKLTAPKNKRRKGRRKSTSGRRQRS